MVDIELSNSHFNVNDCTFIVAIRDLVSHSIFS